MSLTLSSSNPPGLRVKTSGLLTTPSGQEIVSLGDYEIPLADFLAIAWYVLNNTDLVGGEADPRLDFVRLVREMQVVPGHNAKRDQEAKRLSGTSLFYPGRVV